MIALHKLQVAIAWAAIANCGMIALHKSQFAIAWAAIGTLQPG